MTSQVLKKQSCKFWLITKLIQFLITHIVWFCLPRVLRTEQRKRNWMD